MGMLNAYQSFLIPALTPSMYSLGWIAGILFLVPSMGVAGMAWGVVIGAALHLLIQIPFFLRLPGMAFRLNLELKDDQVQEVFRLLAPRLLGVAVVQLNFLVNTRLASVYPGSLTAITLAFLLMLMPEAAIAQSVAIAALPTFSAQYALGKLDDIRHSLAASLRGMLLLAIPASLGLILLREPLISFLYQRGEFDQNSVLMVSWALLWYAAGLVGHSVMEVTSRAFYALHDTRTPVLVGIIAMSLNVGLSYLFMYVFAQIGWLPHGGLALANSLATALEAITLIILMRRRLKGIEGRDIWITIGKAGIASGMMCLILCGWMWGMADGASWIVTLGGIAVGGIVYGLMLWLLRTPEVLHLFQAIIRRIPRITKK
jgi:putative peptidoglycan lipid II flippase